MKAYKLKPYINLFRLEKEKLLVKSEVEEARQQTEHVLKAKVFKSLKESVLTSDWFLNNT